MEKAHVDAQDEMVTVTDRTLKNIDPLAVAFDSSSEALDRLARYETSIERSLFRSVNELLALRSNRSN